MGCSRIAIKGICCCYSFGEVLGQVTVARLLPLRHHHRFYLVGGVHELRSDAVAQAHRHVVLQLEGRGGVLAEEAHLAALARMRASTLIVSNPGSVVFLLIAVLVF